MPSKVPHTAVKAGDAFVCLGPAGGGYGDPLERDPHRVLDDVLDGLISRNRALGDYGVVISEALALDPQATADRRTEMLATRREA
jgi:N-methylhydantoinase B